MLKYVLESLDSVLAANVVIGTKSMVSYDDVTKKLVLHDQRVEVRDNQPMPIKGEGTEIAFAPDEPLRLECEAFLRSIATREPPLTDGASGYRALTILQAAQRSLVTNGQPVLLDRLRSDRIVF